MSWRWQPLSMHSDDALGRYITCVHVRPHIIMYVTVDHFAEGDAAL